MNCLGLRCWIWIGAGYFLALPGFAFAQNTCLYVAPETPFVDGPGETYSRNNHSAEIGLYENGNEMPQARLDNGAFFASQIAASDKYGLVSIGMSNTTQEFSAFMNLAETHAEHLNGKLVLVDAARGGQDAREWSQMTGACSTNIDDTEDPWSYLKENLNDAGLSNEQVRVVWLKLAIMGPGEPSNGSGKFPDHVNVLKDHTACVAKRLKEYLPNLDIIFLSSRTHAGHLSGTEKANELNPEPYAYESGFMVRWLIDEQIKGDHDDLPFLAWGPYLWANGQDSRAYDNFTWTVPEDLKDDQKPNGIMDCTHPSEATGQPKMACLLWNFFSQHPLATPWFLKPGTTPPVESCSSAVDYPDPVDGGVPPPGYDPDGGVDGPNGPNGNNGSKKGSGCAIGKPHGTSLAWPGLLGLMLCLRRRRKVC